MSEEKIVEKKECNCFCKSEGFRKFLVVALGTFTGVYMALSLFTAIHKPPMPHFGYFAPPAPYMSGQFKHHKDFKKFHKELPKDFKGDLKNVKAPDVEDDD